MAMSRAYVWGICDRCGATEAEGFLLTAEGSRCLPCASIRLPGPKDWVIETLDRFISETRRRGFW